MEKYEDSWANIENEYFPWEHSRPINVDDVQKAVDYIKAIVSEYPFQLRHAMALPLWERFAEEFCNTGDVRKALNSI